MFSVIYVDDRIVWSVLVSAWAIWICLCICTNALIVFRVTQHTIASAGQIKWSLKAPFFYISNLAIECFNHKNARTNTIFQISNKNGLRFQSVIEFHVITFTLNHLKFIEHKCCVWNESTDADDLEWQIGVSVCFPFFFQ